jgi:hypothetical protein
MSSTERVKSLTSPVGKCDHEKFVLWVRRLEELHHRFACALDLACHAAAHVEDGTQRNRGILTRKVLNLLSLLPLEDLEILFVQPGHLTVLRIYNRHRHQH